MRQILIIAVLLSFTTIKAQQIKPFFNTISVENGLPEGYIVSSLQDKSGYMWFGTQNGLVRFDGYTLKPYSFPNEHGNPLIQASVTHLLEDKEGKLWAFISTHGLYWLNRQQDKFERVNLDKTDHKIFSDHYFSKWFEDQNSNQHWLLGIDGNTYKPCLYTYDTQRFRFDKIEISSYKNQYPPSLENADILQDAEGKIWVAADSLLSYYEPSSKSFKPWFKLPDSLNNIMITGITEDPEKNEILWITTSIPNLDPVSNPDVIECYQVNTNTQEFRSFKHIKNDPNSIAGNCIRIITDSLNRIWFTTEFGVSLFSSHTETFKNYFLEMPPTASGDKTYVGVISADNEGNLWLGGSFNGLFHLDVKSGKTTLYSHNNDPGCLPDAPRGINKLLTDRSGTFWVFMPWRGVACLDHHKSMLNPIQIESNLNKESKASNPDDFFINGQYSDSIYFVNNTSGLFEWNYQKDSYKRIELKNDKVYRQITSTFVSYDGLIWVGSRDAGLFCYNPSTESVKVYTNDPKDSTSISSNAITVMTDNQEGNMWIGTASQGLCRLNKESSTFTRFPFISNNGTIKANNELDDNRVLSIYLDKNSILWIGTNNGGLNKFDTKTEKFTSYLDQEAGFYCVVNIFEDSYSQLWAGTYLSGMFLFDRETESKTRYSEQDGLIFNAVMGIEEDNSNNIWVASARGLSSLNQENNTISNFHIPIVDLSSNNVLFRGSNGMIQFAIPNGLISFNPEKMNASHEPPSIIIESLSYTSTSNRDTTIFTDGREQVELKFDENKISFRFVALHYANSEQNQYSYKLDGYDKEWIQSGEQRTATYTNLSPGKYTFSVKAANRDGVWNETSSNFIVNISPPWWQTTLAYIIYVLLFITGVIVIDWIQRKRLKEKERSQARDKELAQAKEIEKAYTKLKATQTQLIQSEKMASLGELTAGIAHEIQNPLNFVNNFSEVNTELISELKEEIEQGDKKEALALANDIANNESKIIHHGKRADSIVKGMLQHSRSNGKENVPTDINALADEYLRLSYHGLRAKDKSFNADFKTDFDDNLPKVNVVPQDIGRVMLNLINNAFYAVAETSAKENPNYKPQVRVSTKKVDTQIEIRVNDNGNGIPADIKEKIFLPFFTTKPTGDGTGLGLSMSYDIITKGHNGVLKFESGDGEGTEFIIQLNL